MFPTSGNVGVMFVLLYSQRTRKKTDTTSEETSVNVLVKLQEAGGRALEWGLLCRIRYSQGHMFVQHIIRILDLCSHFEHI